VVNFFKEGMCVTDVVVVETTFPSLEEAKKIASAVITQKLAACCQIIPQLLSIYVWKEKLEETQEVLLRMKTLRSEVPALLSYIEKNHSYKVPELLLFSTESLSQSYFRFVETRVGKV
jgi:periplasmic divalent cation tolerance protein